MSKKNNDQFKENQEVEQILDLESKLDTSNLITTETFPISATVKMTNPGEELKVSLDSITNSSEFLENVQTNEQEPEKLEDIVKPVMIENVKKADKVTETVNKIADNIKDVTNKSVESEKAKEVIHQTVNNVKDSINDAKEKIENKFEDVKKELKKISIIDVSKKKDENKSDKHSNPVANVMDKVAHLASFSPVNKIAEKLDVDAGMEKAFDSLIYLGGGFIAATTVTSKALASVGTYLVGNKK